MRAKQDVLKQELQGIWTLVFGEPPIIEAEPILMARIIKGHLSADPDPDACAAAQGMMRARPAAVFAPVIERSFET